MAQSEAAIQDAIKQRFDRIERIGEGIIKGERRYNDKPFAVAYIDTTDNIVANAQDLTRYQEHLLGPSYFSSSDSLRWNSYIYFVVGPKSAAQDGFLSAKTRIEADRHFARKFVLTPDDLVVRLGSAGLGDALTARLAQRDIGAVWTDLLIAGELEVLLEPRPRTRALDLIGSGKAFQAANISSPASHGPHDDPLATGLLRHLSIGSFRPINTGKRFTFGKVNLIFGPNGSGKTSLLEAIEAFYCGRVRRDPAASFEGTHGEIESLTGKVTKVEATNAVAILKARNLNWYGRPDPLSSTISQGFTRFNFLDTDAAFRMSSTPEPEEIRNDLSKLIIGAETSKLWNYLWRLEEDIRNKLWSLDTTLPSIKEQSELLSVEVKRLREAPTQATALAKSYRVALASLGARWIADTDDAVLPPKDRGKLENVLQSLSRAISALQATPVTATALRKRLTTLQDALAHVKKSAEDEAQLADRLRLTERRVKDARQNATLLEQWQRYCEAGLPALASELTSANARLAELRQFFGDMSPQTIQDIEAPYADRPIGEAMTIARDSLNKAIDSERIAAHAHSQRQELGRTLDALRRDLHDAARALMEESADDSKCPVCGTPHKPDDLVAKIEGLVATLNEPESGLLQAVQRARERVKAERRIVQALTPLASHHEKRRGSATTTCASLVTELRQKSDSLAACIDQVERLNATLNALTRSTLHDWEKYERTRDAARAHFAQDSDYTNSAVLATALEAQNAALQSELKGESQLRTDLANVRMVVASKTLEMGLKASGTDISVGITAIERAAKRLEDALSSLTGAREQISVADDQSLEELRDSVELAITMFDRAAHAVRAEEQAKGLLRSKLAEFDSVSASLRDSANEQQNYVRARGVLSPIVGEHSLARATSDALKAIKAEVGAIFARIHSPQEYELGDFESDRFLLKKLTKQPHGIEQISTGQRAAFALSIFLALNGSAKSAPPVVLIDDPIAHIDDLNALSFLDHLRDLALIGNRQIFFATADARLAGLFQRKFEFLGTDNFRTTLLSA